MLTDSMLTVVQNQPVSEPQRQQQAELPSSSLSCCTNTRASRGVSVSCCVLFLLQQNPVSTNADDIRSGRSTAALEETDQISFR